MLFLVSAGMLANLLVGSLLLGAALHWDAREVAKNPFGAAVQGIVPWMPRSHEAAWLSFAAVMNLWHFVVNLIPSESGGVTSDGGQFLNWAWAKPPAERDLLLLSLVTASHGGVRPRDWDRPLIERLLSANDDSAYAVATNLNAYYHALDCGRIEEASRYLDEAIALRKHRMVEYREGIFLESAYFEAFHRGDAEAARDDLDLAWGGLAERQTRLRAEAAVLLAEGREEEAAAKAQEGLELIPTSIDRGGAIAEEEWLAAILAECQSIIAHPASAVTPTDR